MFFTNNSNAVKTVMSLIFLLLSRNLVAQEKVLIITHCYNRPEFIEIQYKTFKKFLQDEYEFVVFNDAKTEDMALQINAICKQYNIRSIAIPQEIHDRPYLYRLPGDPYHRPNIRHANALQYSLDVLGFNFDGIVAIVDSDLFMVKSMSINDCMKESDIVSVQREAPNGIVYAWPGFVLLKMSALPNKNMLNFNCGKIGRVSVDAGGHTHDYLLNNPQARVRYFDNFYVNCDGTSTITSRYRNMQNKPYNTKLLRRLGFDKTAIELIEAGAHRIEFLLDNHFFHYRSGTNWNHQSNHYHEAKTRLFKKYITTILES